MSVIYKSVNDAIADINKGKVGILPTDTLYGLVAKASNELAVSKMYNLKLRRNKPGTLVASDINQLVDLGLKKRYLQAVEQFWPGAVSVIIPTGAFLGYLHQGKYSLAVRIPEDKELQKLLLATGPLLTTSANLPNQQPARNISEAQKYFGKTVDFYVDGGELAGEPSTVIRVVDDAIEVLRQGKVIINEETGAIIK